VISSLSAPIRVQNCYAGVPGACDDVVLNPNGTIAFIKHKSVNLNALKTSGIDLELVYRTSLGNSVPGDLSVRLLANYVDKLNQIDASGTQRRAGWMSLNSRVSGVPHFNGTADLNYNNDAWGIGLIGHLIGSGKYATSLSEGAGAAGTINKNHVPAFFYLSMNTHYNFMVGDREISFFGVVNNLTNVNPPMIPSGTVGSAAEVSTNPSFYDVIGRSYKVGVRFKL
jgi:hypothetical protein